MPNLSKTTRDHDVIRQWAEERGAKPSHVKRTGSAEDVGILRFDFPGYSGEESLEPISWDQFFEKFDERGLALVYEDETSGGQRSNFNKLISAGSAKGTGRSSARAHSGSGRGSRSGGRTKKAASGGSSRANRSTGRRSTAKKSAGSSKRAGAAKKSASRSAASGARTGARRGAKTASRTGTKKTAAKKTSSGRSSASRTQKKASAKKSARRR
jgi:hypothetical protein